MKHVTAYMLVSFLVVFSAQAEEDDVISKIGALNEASMEWLGISLGALSYLSRITPGTHVPRDYLVESGVLELVNELEGAGYITRTKRLGLPDGQEPEQTFLVLRPTLLGMNVIANITVQSKAITSQGSEALRAGTH